MLSTEAIRPTQWQIEQMAYLMYRADVEQFGTDEGAVMLAWSDPGISGFWTLKALQAIDFLNGVLAEDPREFNAAEFDAAMMEHDPWYN